MTVYILYYVGLCCCCCVNIRLAQTPLDRFCSNSRNTCTSRIDAWKVDLKFLLINPNIGLKREICSKVLVFIFERPCCVYSISSRNLKLGGFEGANYHITTMFRGRFRGREAGQRSKGMILNPFLSNNAPPQPLGRFQQTLYQTLQVSILLSTTKPEFENVAPKRPHIKMSNLRMNF